MGPVRQSLRGSLSKSPMLQSGSCLGTSAAFSRQMVLSDRQNASTLCDCALADAPPHCVCRSGRLDIRQSSSKGWSDPWDDKMDIMTQASLWIVF